MFLVSTSSLSDQELYHQQQQKIVELENQLEKLKHFDSYSHLIQHIDNTTIVNKFFDFCFNKFIDFDFRYQNVIRFYLCKFKNVKNQQFSFQMIY